MTTRKLKNHEYAQAHIEIENDGDSIIYRLVSYETHVATVRETAAGWFLDCYGLYSMTTRRHIGWFLDDIGSPFTFQDAKHSVETGRIVKVYKPGARFCLLETAFVTFADSLSAYLKRKGIYYVRSGAFGNYRFEILADENDVISINAFLDANTMVEG